MTKAARSILVFGLYLIATGLVLIAVPDLLLAVIGLPPTTEPWIRVLGVPVGVIGAFYVAAARAGVVAFFRWTLWGRAIVLVAFISLVLLRLIPPVLILFGIVDAAGAAWTGAALRQETA
jgi:hypothetical protein